MLLEMMMLDDGNAICINQCLCLPKDELKTKNSTRWQVEFLVFNSITHVGKKVYQLPQKKL